MTVFSGGELVLSDAGSAFTYRATYLSSAGLQMAGQTFATYGTIYKSQLWVAVLVRKRALATRRLPFKVYRRVPDGREDASDTAYARLLDRPNSQHSRAFLWEWTSSTLDINGEAIWLKVRGRDDRPAELWPIHPSNIVVERDPDAPNQLVFLYSGGLLGSAEYAIPERDVVQFKNFNPQSTVRGMSPLEPLRATLVNEDAARRANSAFWNNGARPSMYLSHPNKLSEEAIRRLRANWDSIHSGVDNFAKTAVLEEGLEPKVISLSAEESQYEASRKLNREEACAVYDVPPPVVHILDHATFSNITEQMRSMYRDTMAPHLGGLEETLEHALRPDFADEGDIYGEFLMDEVLRGDFEVRTAAYQTGINSGWLMPSEVRELENMPAVEGADRLFVNATLIPIDEVSSRTTSNAPAITPEPLPADTTPTPGNVVALRTVMGRLGNVGLATSLGDIDRAALIVGLNGHGDLVAKTLDEALVAGDDVAALGRRIRHAFEESA